MPPTNPNADPRSVARERLAARRLRFQAIRTRVAVASAAMFVAVFGGLMIQLARGHDPGLSSGGGAAAESVVTGTAASSGETRQPEARSAGSATGLSPVTTRQS